MLRPFFFGRAKRPLFGTEAYHSRFQRGRRQDMGRNVTLSLGALIVLIIVVAIIF
jgi:hypothetical protein